MGEANSFQRRGNCARDFDYEAADLSYDAYLLLVIGKLSYSFYSRIYFKNYCAFMEITENNKVGRNRTHIKVDFLLLLFLLL